MENICNMKSLLLSLFTLCALVILPGCGVTKAIVRNNADSTTTSISIKTSNPTSVSVDPNLSLSVEKDTTKLHVK